MHEFVILLVHILLLLGIV